MSAQPDPPDPPDPIDPIDPGPPLVHLAIEALAAADPDRVAIIGEGFALTRAELEQRTNHLAQLLRLRGVGPEVPVAVCVERSAWLPVALIAVLKSGGAWVPLDPDHPDARLIDLIARTKARLVLTDATHAPRLAAHAPELIDLDALTPGAAPAATTLDPAASAGPASTDLATVIFTSGSTGRPKGVMIEHGQLAARFSCSPYRALLGPDDTLAAITAASWSPSVFELLFGLARGARIALADRATRRDPSRLIAFFAAHGVTFIRAVPSLLRALVDAGWRGHPDLAIVTHGERLPADLAATLRERGRTLLDTFGATEATVFSRVEHGDDEQRFIRPTTGDPAGLRVLAADDRPVAPGDSGEIVVVGPVVARGYLDDPEATARSFLVTHEGRAYRTGDRARLHADGALELLGRADSQVKIRGQRVELGEIEATLGACPGITRALVVARGADPHLRLVAYVEGTPTDDARAWLEARLPPFAVPSAIVRIERWPLNANGKIDRHALPDPALTTVVGATPSPNPSATEATLGAIWAELLERAAVGPDDDLLALGAHSLMAARVALRVREALDLELPLDLFFTARTVRALARALDSRQAVPALPRPGLARTSDPRGPLSFAQERLWFLHRLAPDDPAYNLSLALHITGELDLAALGRALADLVLRHEPLRTRYLAPAGVPHQEILPARPPLAAPIVLDTAELSSRIASLALAPFDLAADVPFRATLFRLSPREHVLLLVIHHIASDGWSQALMRRDLGRLYDHHRHGAEALAPLPCRYLDVAAWQRAWLEGVHARQLAFWRDALAGLDPVELPADHPRPPIFSSRAGRLTSRLDPALTTSLHTLAEARGASLFMVLLAAFEALVHRYTGQRDLAIGSPIAGRVHAETEDLVGLFVNTLVLRTSIDPARPFGDLIERIKTTALDAFAHQDLPFEHLVAELNPQRDPSRHPLVQVVFAHQNTPIAEVAMRDLDVARMPIEAITTRFDLELHVREIDGGLSCELFFSAALFEPWRMRRLLEHYERVLAAVAADPALPIDAIPLLSSAERAQLDGWNATAAPFPATSTLHALFRAQVAKAPDHLAIGGDDALTYGDLDRASDALAAELQARGLAPRARVGLGLERGPALIVAQLAALKAGAAWVPLDPQLPRARLAHLCSDASLTLIATSASRRPTFEDLGPRLVIVDLDARADRAPADPGTTADDPAYVMYTSGSTGRPKGVVVAHRGVVNLAIWHARLEDLGPADRVSQVASPSFDASILEIWPALLTGASLFFPDDETRRVPARLLAWIAAHGITSAFVPTPLYELASVERWPEGLRFVNVGGAALHRRPPAGLPFRLLNHYGPTECTVVATCALVEPGDDAPTIGRPIPNTRAWVLDAAGALAPIGVPGELVLGGVGVGLGYLSLPAETAARFVTGTDGERAYRTGDLARWRPDGELEFLGRIDDQVKLRGYRIELGEIDAVLRAHPAVREAITTVAEHPSGARLVSHVVATRDDDAALLDDYVARWRTLYDDTYAGSAPDPALDLRGWKSSFTGQPIPEAHMREWVELTVDAIMRLSPRRVLEIGCGTGLLLHRLAPQVERYAASDLSAQAIAGLTRHAPANVALKVAPAHDLAWLDEARFDTVILNSVVQYFPSAGYLERVLAAALDHLAPGGAIFVGDVRDLATLGAFHGEIERACSGELPPVELARRVAERVRRDKELVLDRRWFHALRERFPHVTAVEVRAKPGAAPTEMNRYRYDVVVRVAAEPIAHPPTRGPSPSPTLASDPLLTARGQRLEPRLREHLAAELPEYMLPSAFVFLAALPLTPNGKVDRRTLPPPPDQRAGRRPWRAVGSAPHAGDDAEPPRTAGERAVAEAFAEVLGLPRVGRDDDFFALGGHSLLAVSVVVRLDERAGVDIPLTRFFSAPTVAALGRLVDESAARPRGAHDTSSMGNTLDSDADADVVPLTATDLAFHYGKQYLEADARSWYQVLEVRAAPLDHARLADAIRYTVNKHPLLRGRLSRTDTFGAAVYWDARQRVAVAPLDVERADDEPTLERIRQRLVDAMLPLDRAPSCRFTLVTTPGADHLFLRYNHGAVDASGLHCLLDSLMSRYLGRPDPVRRVLPFSSAELLDYYGHGTTSLLHNNEIAHLAGALPESLTSQRGPGWLKGLKLLSGMRSTQMRGQGGDPRAPDPDAIELAFSREETCAIDEAARRMCTTLDRLFLVGLLSGATAWNAERGERGRLEAYWAVNLRPPRYLRSVVANQFAWSRVRMPVEGQRDPWRREMLDPGADFLLRGALDWIQAIEGFDRRRMPDFVRRGVLKASRGLNPALFISNVASVAPLDEGSLARAFGVEHIRLHSRYGATDKPVLVIRRPRDHLDIRMVYPKSLFDRPGADAFLRTLMRAVLTEIAPHPARP